jgi:hypothetical protein
MFNSANLKRSSLFQADLSEADLSEADLSEAILHNTNLYSAKDLTISKEEAIKKGAIFDVPTRSAETPLNEGLISPWITNDSWTVNDKLDFYSKHCSFE